MDSKVAYCTDCVWAAYGPASSRQLNRAMIEHVGATEHEVASDYRSGGP